MAALAAVFFAQAALASPGRLAEITYPFKDQGEFWVNSDPLRDQDLRGRPVLVMFWTYSCYNCHNSFPWVKHVHERFSDQGLLVLGIHTPEFDFEKDRQSVQAKTKEYGLKFPVMLDNDYIFWKDMNNRWWPSFYLADGTGAIIAVAIGETHVGTKKSDDLIALIEGAL